MSDPIPDTGVEDYTNAVVESPAPTTLAQNPNTSVDEYTSRTVDSSPLLESIAQNPDTSVEDYSNTVDPSSLADTVKVADTMPTTKTIDAVKPVITMPDSPMSSGGVREEEGGEANGGRARRGCSTAALLCCVVVALILLGAGLGVGFGTDAFDSILSSASKVSDSSRAQSTPTASPTRPSGQPTVTNSQQPSFIPSDGPSQLPSTAPSAAPTSVATLAPTPVPTEAYYPINPEPSSPPNKYFNYNPDSDYGPPRWGRVNTNDHWLREFTMNGFGVWDDFSSEDLTANVCNGPARKQSPKDLISTTPCLAEHEIRTKCARYPLSNDDFTEKNILPHKLSIAFKRRPCMVLDSDACLEDSPPMIDYPKYASGPLNIQSYSDMQYFDIKVPGEHTLGGESFDAEIQMFLTSLVTSRLSSLGIPVRADDGFDNVSYQTILNEFKAEFDLHALECAQKRLRRRMSLRGARTNDMNNDNADDEESIDEEYLSAAIRNITDTRKLQWSLPNFDPFNDDFMTTMFFYRYDGSITEPPCRDITWWVMNEPMRISRGQLAETKRLLFSHVDSNCVATSVHNSDQSVARPIYPLGEDREIEHCDDGYFRSDVSKGRPPARECRA